jgi:galactokinase
MDTLIKNINFTKKNNMRTLKLTHEQIELICQALGIAENKFTDIHSDIMRNTILVRGNEDNELQNDVADFYFNISTKIADINTDIRNGNFDV